MSDGWNDGRAIATRPRAARPGRREGERPRDAQRLGARRRRSRTHPGDDPRRPRRRPARARSPGRGAARPTRSTSVSRDDRELRAPPTRRRRRADRQLQPPRRDVAHDERARRVPAWRPARSRSRASSAAPRPRRPPTRRAGTSPAPAGGRRRAALLRVPDEQAVERRPVEARPHLGEQRRGAGHRRRRPARAVHRAVERRAVRRGAGLRRRERDPRRGDVRLDAAVEGEPERREARDLAARAVRVGVAAPIAIPTSSPARWAASSSTAAAVGTTTTGAVSSSATRSAPGGSDAP